ncbi:hypothetical protein ACP4OV_004892 [Aristida adscensionis]
MPSPPPRYTRRCHRHRRWIRRVGREEPRAAAMCVAEADLSRHSGGGRPLRRQGGGEGGRVPMSARRRRTPPVELCELAGEGPVHAPRVPTAVGPRGCGACASPPWLCRASLFGEKCSAAVPLDAATRPRSAVFHRRGWRLSSDSPPCLLLVSRSRRSRSPPFMEEPHTATTIGRNCMLAFEDLCSAVGR